MSTIHNYCVTYKNLMYYVTESTECKCFKKFTEISGFGCQKLHFLVKASPFLIPLVAFLIFCRMCGCLIVSDSSSNCPAWVHCAMFLDKTLYPHSAPLHPGIIYRYVA